MGSRRVDFSKKEMRVDRGVRAHPCTELVINSNAVSLFPSFTALSPNLHEIDEKEDSETLC